MEQRKVFSAEQKQRRDLLEASEGLVPVASTLGAVPSGQATSLERPMAATVDTGEILDRIAILEAKLDRFLAHDHVEIERIRMEIEDISGRIKATKAEIAQIRHPLANEDKFQEASQQLMAVVSSTEDATNIIMNCAEQLEEIVNEVRDQLPEGYQAERLGVMNDIIIRMFEACNFQDLTGQRITKVVRTLAFVEERVNAMISVWNMREFETLPLPKTTEKEDGGLILHGPTKESVSQADIDALFT